MTAARRRMAEEDPDLREALDLWGQIERRGDGATREEVEFIMERAERMIKRAAERIAGR